ncbi:hypothetical protein GGG16DRAFT_113481 [Schizophyllum commune]
MSAGLGAVYANITAHCKAFADAYPQASSTLSNILDHAQSAGSPDAPSIYAEILRNLKAYSTASAESEKVQLQAVVNQLVSTELEAIAALIAQAQANAGEYSKFLSETFDQDQSALSAQSDTLGSEIRAYAAKEGPPVSRAKEAQDAQDLSLPAKLVLADLATVSTSLDDLLQANSAAIVAVQTMASIWVQIANDLRSIQAIVQTDLNVSTPFEIILIIAKNLEKKWNDLAAFVYRFKEATAMQL